MFCFVFFLIKNSFIFTSWFSFDKCLPAVIQDSFFYSKYCLILCLCTQLLYFGVGLCIGIWVFTLLALVVLNNFKFCSALVCVLF